VPDPTNVRASLSQTRTGGERGKEEGGGGRRRGKKDGRDGGRRGRSRWRRRTRREGGRQGGMEGERQPVPLETGNEDHAKLMCMHSGKEEGHEGWEKDV
jgi:hypothetical protein